MRITVDRFVSDHDTTISRVYVDKDFFCFGLEDEYRKDKLAKETRIPCGLYNVILRKKGEHHMRYKARFPDIHNGMLHIVDVPGFEYILIHCGNTQADTDGCLLVGSSANTEVGNMHVTASGLAYQRLYKAVSLRAEKKELEIEFVDNDLVVNR